MTTPWSFGHLSFIGEKNAESENALYKRAFFSPIRNVVLALFVSLQIVFLPNRVLGYGQPIVVQVDSRHSFMDLDPYSHSGRKFTALTIKGQELVCGDISYQSTNVQLPMIGSTITNNIDSKTIDNLDLQGNFSNEELIFRLLDGTKFNESEIVWQISRVGPGVDWSLPKYDWSPESQTLRYLIASKLSYFTKFCFIFKKALDTHWVYDICIGRTIGQYPQARQNRLTHGVYYNLGVHDSTADHLFANGTVVQEYRNGTDGRHTTLLMTCGVDSHPLVTSITERELLHYIIIFKGASFCDWREKGKALARGKPASISTEAKQSTALSFANVGADVELSPNDTLEADKGPTMTINKTRVVEKLKSFDLRPAQLLHGLEGWCSNFTDGSWWSYEYCHPDSLIQFHIDMRTGAVDSKTMNLLGAFYSFGSPLQSTFQPIHARSRRLSAPNPSPNFVFLRSPHKSPPQPSDPIRWPSLPIEKISAPTFAMMTEANHFKGHLKPKASILDVPLQALSMRMQNGTRCGKGSYRQTEVIFMCPIDFIQKPQHQIINIREVSLCHYQVHVVTPIICGHPQLLPQRLPEPETVICYPRRPYELDQSDLKANGIKTLEVEEEPQQSAASVDTIQAHFSKLGSSPELLPPTFEVEPVLVGIEPSIKPQGVFGLGYYIRSRNLSDTPKFRIGDVVHHSRLDVKGAVIEWDFEARASTQWIEQIVTTDPTFKSQQPFYLILLDETLVKQTGKDLPVNLAYTPEESLARPQHLRPITNDHIAFHFSVCQCNYKYSTQKIQKFDEHLGRYISARVEHEKLYPDDNVRGDTVLHQDLSGSQVSHLPITGLNVNPKEIPSSKSNKDESLEAVVSNLMTESKAYTKVYEASLSKSTEQGLMEENHLEKALIFEVDPAVPDEEAEVDRREEFYKEGTEKYHDEL